MDQRRPLRVLKLPRAPKIFSSVLVAGGSLLLAFSAPRVCFAQSVQEQITAEVVTIRGLSPKAPVPIAFTAPGRLRERVLAPIEEEATVSRLEISRKLLVMLGLLSPDTDLQSLLVERSARDLQGYYDRNDAQVHMVDDRSAFGFDWQLALAHEFTHALQDQYFGLDRLEVDAERNGDRARAATALLEGDAGLTAVLYAQRVLRRKELVDPTLESGDTPSQRAPPAIRDLEEFPHQEGFLFALRLWQLGRYDRLDAALLDPPSSTAQVIHPEKYLAHQEPIDVSLPDLAAVLGPEWRELRSDVLGELELRIVLEQFSDPYVAAKGAEGWTGDRFSLLESATGEQALLISTAWDGEGEAGEFFNLYAGTVRARYGRRAPRTEDVPSKVVWATPNGALLLQNGGRRSRS